MDNFDKMDSLSEVSSTTTNSRTQINRWYSEENRKLIARKLDLSNGTRELHMDQVQVDRRRLESLLFPDNENPNENKQTADMFFNKIMMDTNTHITWPTRLKAGTKTKKNPFVNIAGRYSNVAMAKSKILKHLENKSKKIVMKIDVSYTDHSHIIGRGGSSIQKVMDETKCHIHFPDSNRTNPMEKNNQVSVHGDVEHVERARGAIRNLSSLIFCFELPTTLNQLESRDILIDQVSADYNVRVSFRKHSVLSDSMIIVKGNEYEVERVKKATLLLSEQLFRGRTGPIAFCTSMEISIQHHSKVLGEKSANLLKIMKYTNTEIIFADSNDPNVPVLKKSNVVIKGALEDIYRARQLLTGLLPVSIAFDVTSDRLSTLSNSTMMLKLMEVHDVKIAARQKFGQTNGEYAIVKGYERNVGAIYKVRNIILGLDNDNVVVGIPRTYIPPTKLLCGRFHDTTSTVTTQNVTAPPYKASSSPPASKMWTSPVVRNVTKPYSRPINNAQIGNILYQSNTLPRNIKSPRGVNQISTELMGQKLPIDSNASSFYQLFANDSSTNTTSEWDYERTRMAAVRAIKNSDRNLNTNRLPTSMWSGFGVSNTSPAALQTNDNRSMFYNDCTIEALKNFERENEYDRFSVSSINCSNIIDDTSNMTVRRVIETNWNDIADVLVSLNLEKYITIFETNDIDLALFGTLKESDLVDLGVISFGARRKLLLAISEINKRKNTFSLAPGAERFRN